MGVNYGLNKVRFMAPVPVGGRFRTRMKLLAADPIDNAGLQMTWQARRLGQAGVRRRIAGAALPVNA